MGEPVDGVAVDADAVEVGGRRRAPGRCSRRASAASAAERRRSASAAQAAPKPTMAGTFSMPARRARSWSPPTQQRVEAQAPAHEQRADARRPAELVGADRQQVGAERRRSRSGTWPAAWAASTCTSTPRSRQAATTSATGWRGADLVVAPLHVDERGVGARWRRARASASTRPEPSTPTTVTSPCALGADARTAECSTAGTTWCAPRSARAPARGGDRLGGPAGEHDLAGPGAERARRPARGPPRPRPARPCPRRGCGPGRRAGAVEPRRPSPSTRLGPQRRRRRVVEVVRASSRLRSRGDGGDADARRPWASDDSRSVGWCRRRARRACP